jgi:hypothetical protein
VVTRKPRSSTRFVKDSVTFQRTYSPNAAELHDHPSSTPRVEKLSNAEGQAVLQIVFPSVHRGERPFVLDVSSFFAAPELAEFLAHGLARTLGNKPTISTANGYRSEITAGIVSFVKRHLPSIRIHELSRSLMNSFINWLNGTVGGTPKLSIATRSGYYVRFRRIVEELRDTDPWKTRIPHSLSFPPNPWPNQNAYTTHIPALDNDLATRIRLACLEE